MLEKPLALSVKIALSDGKGQWLFLRRNLTTEWNPGRWDLPGGKVRPGEEFPTALIREALEETGLTVSVHGVLGAVGDETKSYRVAHLVLTGLVESGELSLSEEHSEAAWVPTDDIPTLPLCGYLHDLLVTQQKPPSLEPFSTEP